MPGIVAPTNFARATVASPPAGTGGLSFSVAAGKGALFPAPGAGFWFYGVFTNAARSKFEVVKVEARAGDGFTIAAGGRGQDGTAADTWAAGDIFMLPTTGKMWLETAFSAAALALALLTPAANKIAYFTSATAAALADLTAYGRSLIAAADAAATRVLLDVYNKAEVDTKVNALWTTGDAKLTFKTVADAGWVMANDGSIGSAASGATTRANADTEALYTLLWNNVTDAWAPVSGGRGASAAADFAADKTLSLPKALGRAIAVAGAGAGLTARPLGSTVGAETHTLTQAQTPLKDHVHGVTDPGHGHTMVSTGGNGGGDGAQGGAGVLGSLPTSNNPTGISIQNTGNAAADPHPIMSPETFMNAMVKL